jgi:anaerobic magnesium-protoporphyrin IX monomethyl ester cyclase
MKIILIDLPHVYLMQQMTQAPMGIMYLGAVLEKNGHDVSILRLNNLEKIDTIEKADIYGISSVSLDYSSTKIVAKKLRETKSGKIIIGGYHATVETDKVLNEKDDSGNFLWDCVCVGEFESKILDVINSLYENIKIDRLQRGLITNDLDTLPFPARHLIKDQGSSIFAYDKHYSDNKLSTVICSSRGCPFNCCFCATGAMWGNRVRFRSAKNLIEEMNECIDKYDIREFRFSDELFTVNRKRTMSLMEWFKGKNIYWKCSTRTDCVDKELLIAMRDGGCKEIAFGIESADENVLVAIDKRNDIKKNIEALHLCNNIGINTRVLMMINTPGETVDTVDKNIEFLESIPYTCASLSVFKPLPGSPAWMTPEKFGIKIKDRDLDKYNIYMWIKGQLDENNSEDVFEILTLPSIEHQINNRKRMLEYFYGTKKMNELDKAMKQKDELSNNDK